jgi:predicted nucleotide-binding protein
MADTSTRSSLLRADLEELLQTTPPLATRRQHNLPDNQRWLGRAASIVERWDSARSPAFAELNRQFHVQNAHEANDAFEQMMVLLRQAQHDLEILDQVAGLKGYLRQLQAQDEVILKAGTQQIPVPVSTLLGRLFNEIIDRFPGLNLQPFSGHAQPAALRAQIAAAIQTITGYLQSNSTPTTVEQGSAHPTNPASVFVIHGRQLRDEFHAFLRALRLEPLEWSEARKRTGKPNPYTWEIVDLALREAGAIVALLTPDDEARLAKHLWSEHENAIEKERLLQPRQNALFEAGVAYGRAPKRTVLIRIGSQRPMSDLAGHHILQLDESPQSRQSVADALQTAGCPVNLSGSDWFRAGKFSTAAAPKNGGDETSAIDDTQDKVGTGNPRTMALRMLFEEADYLHRVYRHLDEDNGERVRLPLFGGTRAQFGNNWDFVDATLFSHASRVDWLIRTSRSAWFEMKWPVEPVELFQMNEHSTMVDLLHALDEFRRLLRTKYT